MMNSISEKYVKKVLCIFLFLTLPGLEAATITVGPDAPYKTINAGLKAMKPGDTMIIEPGEYFESVERRQPIGARGVRTVIKARRPGSVLIRGDKPAPRFTLKPGSRFIWETPWDHDASAVNERDTLSILTPAPTCRDLEYTRGRFFLDRQKKKLYISTTDGKRPDEHFYTVSVIRGSGLYLWNPVDLVIEGLMVTGFYSLERLDVRKNVASGCYGIRINHPVNSTIRNCVAFLNANGIHSGHGDGGVIENCIAYANGSLNPSSGGNIMIWGPARNAVIRNCVSFWGTQPEGKVGIRIYQGPVVNCRIENCISFGQQPITAKVGKGGAVCINNFSREGFNLYEGANNAAFAASGYQTDDKGVLRLDKFTKNQRDKAFADPENQDFRPQKDFPGISAGLKDRGDVYFVSPAGDDRNHGRSVSKAWKSFKNLRPRSTVYILPGDYKSFTLTVPGVTLRTRGGREKAVFHGPFSVAADQVTLRDLNFIKGSVTVRGKEVSIRCCGFEKQLLIKAPSASVTHNAFLESPLLHKETLFHSNLQPGVKPVPLYTSPGTGDFTLKNFSAFAGRGFDALPLGPYRLVRKSSPARIFGPFLRSVSPGTANIEWWTDKEDVSSELYWGGDPSCGKPVGHATFGGSHHTATLTGLKPGRTYYFRVFSRAPLREHHSNVDLAFEDELKGRQKVASETRSFTMPLKFRAAKTFYVSPKGSDRNPGSRKAPFQTISQALDTAVAGDTVIVGNGVYKEHAVFRSGGDRKAPLTVRAAEPGKAVIDGNRLMPVGFSLKNQSFIRIDGFKFRFLKGSSGSGIRINGGSDITISRCFSDGRSYDYTPGLIYADNTVRLTIENCLILAGNRGGHFWRCPELLLRNNAWHLNSLGHFYIHNAPDEKVYIRNNIFSENEPQKFIAPLLGFWHLESAVIENNAFDLRVPLDNRALLGYTRCKGDKVALWTNSKQFIRDGGIFRNNICAEPQWPVMPRGILKFKKLYPMGVRTGTEWKEADRRRKEVELGYTKTGITPWQITGFISGNRELIKKNIGLEPEKFKLEK